jgi:FAD/FMN-containing dehydrogenase
MAASLTTRLRESLAGPVLDPGDPGYDTARSIFNSMIDTRPAAIAQVQHAADVAAALRIAREADVAVSVRGGGHGVTGSALCEGVVIDLSNLRAVTVDPHARTATAGGGCTWIDVDSASQEHQLATPGGRVTHTGIAGLTLGGGQGWLSPKHGLASDNLLAAEVVTADGRTLTASEDENADLLWGLRGGGGNLGVVTSFTYRLHPLGPVFQGGILVHPLERAPELVAFYSDFVARNPGTYGGALVFTSAPPAPGIPPEAVGAPVVVVAAAWFDSDLAAGERALRPLREFGPPLVDLIMPMPYSALQSMIDDRNQPGFRNHWSASYTAELPAPLVTDLMDAAATKPSMMSNVIVMPMGAAVRAVAEDATAFPNRDATWLFHPLAMWSDPADDEVNRQWARGLNAKAAPHAVTGSYLNVDADASTDRVRWAYGEDKYHRLAALKQSWDPDNVFQHKASIPPMIDLVPKQEASAQTRSG